MYNNGPYQEYMQNNLGYNPNPMINMYPYQSIYEEDCFTYNDNVNADNMYPEIYRIIYPMICKACMNINENISEDLVSRITDEIYQNIECDEMTCENRKVQTNNSTQNIKSVKPDVVNNRTTPATASNNVVTPNTRQENRNRNPLLRDLIRILVLRELIGNQNNRPRPPFRPQYPGPRTPYMF